MYPQKWFIPKKWPFTLPHGCSIFLWYLLCGAAGVLQDTIIGEGTKMDNLIQIAHNVQIGKHCVIAGQSAIAGSTILGDYVRIAGQVGIIGHLSIGNKCTIICLFWP